MTSQLAFYFVCVCVCFVFRIRPQNQGGVFAAFTMAGNEGGRVSDLGYLSTIQGTGQQWNAMEAIRLTCITDCEVTDVLVLMSK